MSAKTTPLGPFSGINNRFPDHQLAITGQGGRKAGDYLRNAVNVDLAEGGTLHRRKGSTLEVSGTNCHSLWARGAHAYYVDEDTIYAFPRTPVATGVAPSARVSFEETPLGDVIWTDGARIERISGGASAPLGPAVPNPAPTVSAASGGSLVAGVYQVAVTAVGAGESGSTWPVQVFVPDEGVLQLSDMPAGMKNIYVSACNGDVLFLAVTTTATTYNFPITPPQGQQCPTLYLAPMPPGQIVRVFNGRLLVAVGSAVAYSEPYAHALQNPGRGFVMFPGQVTLLEPCENGVFVATEDETYWLAGADIDKSELNRALPYGAAIGATARSDTDSSVWWFSKRGLVVGDPTGQAKNVQEKTVAVSPTQSGAALVRDQDGLRQVVSSLRGVEQTVAAASSYFDAEIVRKESML